MANITIKQLAGQLKLSAGTVSKALKDSHEISAETKKRVQELVQKLNYVPNPYASSLRKRKSKTIAVVLPTVADSFFSEVINGIESIAQQKSYHVLIYLTHESFLKEQAIMNEFKSGRVDGVLISVSSETTKSNHIHELQLSGIPVVLFDRVCEDLHAAKVTTNDLECGYLATKHLIEQGCKRIFYLSISKELAIMSKRIEGFKKALAQSNIESGENSVVFCSNDDMQNFDIISELLSSARRPDAILASVEKLATTVYHVCNEMNISVPGEIKVACFSNLFTAFILNPSLTTITQPAFEMGAAAATLLFKALEKSNFSLADENIVIPSGLYVRDSTGKKNL
jgi:LacI family transcriptional regulator